MRDEEYNGSATMEMAQNEGQKNNAKMKRKKKKKNRKPAQPGTPLTPTSPEKGGCSALKHEVQPTAPQAIARRQRTTHQTDGHGHVSTRHKSRGSEEDRKDYHLSRGTSHPVSNHVVYIHPSVCRDMENHICRFQPERGGFLFGWFTPDLVISRFVLDQAGATSSVSYYPSHQAPRIIQDTERNEKVQFLGVVHSHPSYLDEPSGPDETAMQSLLDLNRHMPFVVAPIITQNLSHRGDHEKHLGTGQHKISFFIKPRQAKLSTALRVEDTTNKGLKTRKKFETRVNSICHTLADEWGYAGGAGGSEAKVTIQWVETQEEGVRILAQMSHHQKSVFLIFSMATYPAHPPSVFVQASDSSRQQFVFSHWPNHAGLSDEEIWKKATIALRDQQRSHSIKDNHSDDSKTEFLVPWITAEGASSQHLQPSSLPQQITPLREPRPPPHRSSRKKQKAKQPQTNYQQDSPAVHAARPSEKNKVRT